MGWGQPPPDRWSPPRRRRDTRERSPTPPRRVVKRAPPEAALGVAPIVIDEKDIKEEETVVDLIELHADEDDSEIDEEGECPSTPRAEGDGPRFYIIEDMTQAVHYEKARLAIASMMELPVVETFKKQGAASAISATRSDQKEVAASFLPTSTCTRRALEVVNAQARGVDNYHCPGEYTDEQLLERAPAPLGPTTFIPTSAEHASRNRSTGFMPADIPFAGADRGGSPLAAVDSDARIALGGLSFLENAVGALMRAIRCGDRDYDMQSAVELAALIEAPLASTFSQTAYHISRAIGNATLLRRDAKHHDSREVGRRLRAMPLEMQDLTAITPKVVAAVTAGKREDVFNKQVLTLAAAGARSTRHRVSGKGFERSRPSHRAGEARQNVMERLGPQVDQDTTEGAYTSDGKRGGRGRGAGGAKNKRGGKGGARGGHSYTKNASGPKKSL